MQPELRTLTQGRNANSQTADTKGPHSYQVLDTGDTMGGKTDLAPALTALTAQRRKGIK